MNKSDLTTYISDHASISKSEAEVVLNSFLNAVTEGMADDKKVSLAGFGVFSKTERNARIGRNPQTGEAIQIPAKNSVRFKPYKGLLDLIN